MTLLKRPSSYPETASGASVSQLRACLEARAEIYSNRLDLMTTVKGVAVGFVLFVAAACSGPDIMRGVDGIAGWKRTGPAERYNKEGLYGHINGGAEIVLQYGFHELSVSRFVPGSPSPLSAAPGTPPSPKELVLEIYRMTSGEAAFSLYSTKLEGGEKGWPGIPADNWISSGQANLVKGGFLVNILAPGCTEREIGEFMAALEPKIPGRGTVRPKGLGRLPLEGMIPSSRRYIRGPLAAQNESPFLEGDFWGFAGAEGAQGATEAFSAKYGGAKAVSKLVVVELGKAVSGSAVEEGVFAAFNEYLKAVRRDGARLEGQNEAGRWFLFRRSGIFAVLVLGDPDRASALARLDSALGQKPADPIR